MTVPEVFVAHDAASLSDAVAARLVTSIVDHQAAAGHVTVLVGGDPLALGVLAAVAASPARDAIDYEHIDLWWTNDAWAATDDPTRASTRAEAILSGTGLSAAALHPVPGPAESRDPGEAAEQYAAALSAAREVDDHGALPGIDILVLGMGADGSVAGISPEQPAAHEVRAVTAVPGSGHRGPQVTLTLPALAAADEAWVVASGEASSAVVHLALSRAGPVQVPAAGVRGRQRTLVFLDDGAAKRLPASMRRIASP
ncbi:MAG: 6-phosphogluconolactonase [Actinomycetes bacterium]